MQFHKLTLGIRGIPLFVEKLMKNGQKLFGFNSGIKDTFYRIEACKT